MNAPSMITIKKGDYVMTSKIDLAKYTIEQLTRRAMIDVGRYVTYGTRKNLREAFPFTKSHQATKRYQYWVPKKENCLVLGIENRKHGAVTAWWADQLETGKFVIPLKGKFAVSSASKLDTEEKPASRAAKGNKKKKATGLGTANIPRRHLLEQFVKKHTREIVEIERLYLTKLNDEAAAVALAKQAEDMEVMRGDES